jgi:hypothetical protein
MDGAPRQRLGDLPEKEEARRSGEEEAAQDLASVHRLLHEAEELGNALDLVQGDGPPFPEKRPGRLACPDLHLGIVERHVAPRGAHGSAPDEGALPRLAGPGQDHDGEGAQAGSEPRFEQPAAV